MGSRNINRRKRVFERLSSDGKILFRYYDTGALVGLDSRHPGQKPNGSEGGYLRFNNLKNITPLMLDKVLDRLTAIGITERPFIVDFNTELHMKLLRSWVATRSQDKWISFTAFLSAVKETRGEITFKQAITLVKANSHLLEKAKDLGALDRMFRSELGFLTSDFPRRTDYTGILELQKLIAERRTSRAYAHHFKRFEEGLETQAVVASRSSEFKQGLGFVFSTTVSGLLTAEEYESFTLIVRKAMGRGLWFYFDEKISFLLSYALINHGTSRAIDFLMFIMQQHNASKDEGSQSVYFSRLAPYNEQTFTEELLYEAISDDEYPLEWALMIRQE